MALHSLRRPLSATARAISSVESWPALLLKVVPALLLHSTNPARLKDLQRICRKALLDRQGSIRLPARHLMVRSVDIRWAPVSMVSSVCVSQMLLRILNVCQSARGDESHMRHLNGSSVDERSFIPSESSRSVVHSCIRLPRCDSMGQEC